MRNKIAGIPSHLRILLAANAITLALLISIRAQLLLTCGGLLNLWQCLEFFLLLGAAAFLLIWLLFLRSRTRTAGLMAILNVSAIIFFLTFRDPGHWRFQLWQRHYEAAAELIGSGQVAVKKAGGNMADNEGNLPLSQQYLAACGGHYLYREENGVQFVFFFEMVDWFSFTGYLHSPNGSLPGDGFFPGISPRTRIDSLCTAIKPDWYYCKFFD